MKNKRALVVDDSLTIRRIVSNILRGLKFEKDNIIEAEDGMKAWNILKNEEFDIILTDWNMPNMDGHTLVTHIRNTENPNKDTKTIMITTERGKTEVIKALRAGVNDYIGKPIEADILSQKIKDLLSRD
jgi:two-component system chemotaxis response regulator CheY